MTRLLLVCVFAVPGVAWAGIVPPVPFLPKEEPEPAPAAPGEKEDPLVVIARITKTARDVGDRLKGEDAGTDTQKAQDQLLRDIDSLLPPPPPMGGGGGGSPPPPSSSPPPPGGSGSDTPPPMGGESPPPRGGNGGGQSKRPRGDRKPDQGGGGEKQPMGGKEPMPMPMGGGNDPKPTDMGGGGGKEPMPAGGGGPGTGGRVKPDLPLDDPFTKRVWGHLPEKLRQQAMQSYREQFMPQYAEMLKQYYSTLNEKQNAKPPR